MGTNASAERPRRAVKKPGLVIRPVQPTKNKNVVRELSKKVNPITPIRSMSMSEEDTSEDSEDSDYSVQSSSTSSSDYEVKNPKQCVKKARAPPTELMLAANRGNIKIMKKLVSQGAHINVLDGHGRTALYHACVAGEAEAVQFLMCIHGLDLNKARHTGDCHSPLHCAILKSEEIVRLFVQLEATDVNQRTRGTGMTPLMLAVNRANAVAFEMLMMREDLNLSVVDNVDQDVLWYAVDLARRRKRQDPMVHKILEALIARGMDLNRVNRNEHNKTVFQYVADCNPHLPEVFDLFLRQPGIDVNVRSGDYCTTPLIDAVMARKYDFVEKLLQRPEIDVNYRDNRGMSALTGACAINDLRAVNRLVAFPGVEIASAREGDDSPIHIAAQRVGPMLKMLLSREDIDVNAKGRFNETPLIQACIHAPKNIPILLRDPRVDVNITDNDNKTAYWLICGVGAKPDIARTCLRRPGMVLNAVSRFAKETVHVSLDEPTVWIYLRLTLLYWQATKMPVSKKVAAARAAGQTRVGGWRRWSRGGEWVRRRPRGGYFFEGMEKGDTFSNFSQKTAY